MVGILGITPDGCRLARSFTAQFRAIIFDVAPNEFLFADRDNDEAAIHIPAGIEVSSELSRIKEPDTLFLILSHSDYHSQSLRQSARLLAFDKIAQELRSGQLIVHVSKCPPGTTRAILLPIITRKRLEMGPDLFLAYCANVLEENVISQ
jgi:UDP-N-acetyl-D-mannosaminuronate dehydrogenase